MNAPALSTAYRTGELKPLLTEYSRVNSKEVVSDLLTRLPDDVSLQEIARKIEFIAGVLEGFESYEREGGLSTEEVRARISSWAKAATR